MTFFPLEYIDIPAFVNIILLPIIQMKTHTSIVFLILIRMKVTIMMI